MYAELLTRILQFAAEISGVATILGGALASGFAKYLFEYFSKRGEQAAVTAEFVDVIELPPGDDKHKRLQIAEKHTNRRLSDIRNQQRQQRRLAATYKLASNSLVFGQYVIGGAMTTSFMQKQLSSETVGIFGLLVLISSIIRQHYHPERAAQEASARAAKLKILHREGEDQLAIINSTVSQDHENPTEMLALLTSLSKGLKGIEESSAYPIAPRKRKTLKETAARA